jgi:hypothetical protein
VTRAQIVDDQERPAHEQISLSTFTHKEK